jgi:hypothetical protein
MSLLIAHKLGRKDKLKETRLKGKENESETGILRDFTTNDVITFGFSFKAWRATVIKYLW